MDRPAVAAATPALISAALLLLLAAGLFWPPIGDVTTTPDAPPRFRTTPPGNVPYPEQYAVLQRRAYPDLEPVELDRSVPAAIAAVSAAISDLPSWDVVVRDDSLGVLQAVAAGRIPGLSHDVVVEVRSHADGSTVHVRSRSRTGRVDFGANARRIRELLDRLD